MTENPDDRPLSSEEMIRQARADLGRPPVTPERPYDDARIRDDVDEEMPITAVPPAVSRHSPRPRATRRVTRVERRAPTGFEEPDRRGASPAIALAAAIVLLILGLAVFLVVAASVGG